MTNKRKEEDNSGPANETPRQSEALFRTLVENQAEGVCMIDSEENIVFANPAGESIFGVEKGELKGRNMKEFLDPDNTRLVREQTALRRQGKKSQYEVTIIRPDGERRLLLITAAPNFGKDGSFIGAFGVFADITNRKQMEEEVARSQKLESVGLLAGGIAHDFNNILTAILGNISLARARGSQDETIHRYLAEAEKACLQAKNLSRKLLVFSKGGEPVMFAVDLSPIIKEIVSLALSGSKISCRFLLPEKLRTVRCDPFQIEQVVNNLILNAVQSMPGGGEITVQANTATIPPEGPASLPPGEYVRIAISDQGEGIPANNLKKVFDPFFSTRKGSGLGLSIAYSIIKNHGGTIQVESEPKKGATFTFFLPAETGAAAGKKPDRKVKTTEPGRALVVDDQEMIRSVATEMITSLGWRVETASDSASAIEIYRRGKEEGRPFDVVLLDLTMPGDKGGMTTFKKLRDIDPKVKAIVTSGYSEDPVMSEWQNLGFAGALAKPYRIKELEQTLKTTAGGNK